MSAHSNSSVASRKAAPGGGIPFINVTTGLTLVLTGFVADGLSSRSIKILMIAILMLFGGAAGTHLTVRALLWRGAP